MGLGAGLSCEGGTFGSSGCDAPFAICFWRRAAAFCWDAVELVLALVEVLICESVRSMGDGCSSVL